ncbi:hypothetical protein [Pusillimonas sp. ANT_WB101]|uniref:hypothetical protein n=1 Tax=Pusillimonas sp. ANT_WB101 TaxID=2597356 RepID=UPI00165D3DEF|nr:hypothetical protein [Pusillimonas sp. ANT_WB101]
MHLHSDSRQYVVYATPSKVVQKHFAIVSLGDGKGWTFIVVSRAASHPPPTACLLHPV